MLDDSRSAVDDGAVHLKWKVKSVGQLISETLAYILSNSYLGVSFSTMPEDCLLDIPGRRTQVLEVRRKSCCYHGTTWLLSRPGLMLSSIDSFLGKAESKFETPE